VKRRVAIVELISSGATHDLYSRVMLPSFGTVMSQVVAVWCQQAGHSVRLVSYVGRRGLDELGLNDFDIVFFCAFTHAALAAYAASRWLRSCGVVTVLGGPHARAYPEHARRQFDYVVGLADRALVENIVRECAPQQPGLLLSSARQPASLPGLAERWPFLEQSLDGALIHSVGMLGSLGCPYTCSFCVDAEVAYQPLDLDEIRRDLRFLLGRVRRPRVVWHDPNFGVRFEEYLGAIEDVVPPGSIDFIAESSLSILSEARLPRLRRNGFKALLPGIESWYELGNKSKTGREVGAAKVEAVAEHINAILRHIPYVQTNFVHGLDSDEGDEPFELTARFIDRVPGAFVAVAFLTIYGQSAPLGEQHRAEGRLVPVPFQFMNSGYMSNARPRHYSFPQLYDHMIRLLRHNFAWSTIWRRHRAVASALPRWINLVRAVSAEGRGRVAYLESTRRRFDTDPSVRRFFDGESTDVPYFLREQIDRKLGRLRAWLPPDALAYDPNEASAPLPISLRRRGALAWSRGVPR
jgi:radical SAM superfamily enzyme YgiQ (UPF0313 family)